MSQMSGWVVVIKYTHRWYRLFLVCRFVLLVLGFARFVSYYNSVLCFLSRCYFRSFAFCVILLSFNADRSLYMVVYYSYCSDYSHVHTYDRSLHAYTCPPPKVGGLLILIYIFIYILLVHVWPARAVCFCPTCAPYSLAIAKKLLTCSAASIFIVYDRVMTVSQHYVNTPSISLYAVGVVLPFPPVKNNNIGRGQQEKTKMYSFSYYWPDLFSILVAAAAI